MFSPHKTLSKLDYVQQKTPGLNIAVGIVKTSSDVDIGSLTSLATYYAFVSLFPLLMTAVTISAILIDNNPELTQRITNSALTSLPVIGQTLGDNVTAMQKAGAGLIAGLLISLWSVQGFANSLQHAANTIWAVPDKLRPGFARRIANNYAIIGILAIGVTATSIAATIGTNAHIGIIWLAVMFICNFCTIAGLYRVATAAHIAAKPILLSAAFAGVGWTITQNIGTYLINSQLGKLTPLYGAFAVVLGLIFWLYLLIRILLWAMVIARVTHNKLWPRSFM